MREAFHETSPRLSAESAKPRVLSWQLKVLLPNNEPTLIFDVWTEWSPIPWLLLTLVCQQEQNLPILRDQVSARSRTLRFLACA